MALNYKSDSETQSAITATTNGTAIDLRGYSQLAIQTKFATCTGTTNSASLKVQTSNDNTNWADILTIWSHADVVDADSDNYFDYLPDNATASQTGFGRYIRFVFTGTGTFSASYTVYWEAKE